jgi:hypothetical protein
MDRRKWGCFDGYKPGVSAISHFIVKKCVLQQLLLGSDEILLQGTDISD